MVTVSEKRERVKWRRRKGLKRKKKAFLCSFYSAPDFALPNKHERLLHTVLTYNRSA